LQGEAQKQRGRPIFQGFLCMNERRRITEGDSRTVPGEIALLLQEHRIPRGEEWSEMGNKRNVLKPSTGNDDGKEESMGKGTASLTGGGEA